MKYATKITLACAALAGLCAIYFGNEYFVRQKEAQEKKERVALPFSSAQVTKINLKNTHGSFTFERKKDGSPWTITSPQTAHADQYALNEMLVSLADVPVQQYLEGTQEAAQGKDVTSLESFGLKNPLLSISVSLENGKSETLEFGNPVSQPFLSANGASGFASYYARSPHKKELMVLGSQFATTLENKTWADFRTKNVTSQDLSSSTEIEIDSKDQKILASKSQGEWHVKKPYEVLGDTIFISSFLEHYKSLESRDIVEKEDLAKIKDEGFDTAHPAARVIFRDDKGKEIQSFSLGLTPKHVYMSMEDGAWAALSLEDYPELVPLADNFANKQILLGISMKDVFAVELDKNHFYVQNNKKWYLKKSLLEKIKEEEKSNDEANHLFSSLENMSAAKIFPHPSPTDLKTYGVNNPVKTLKFHFDADKKTQPIEIIIGNRVPKNERKTYIYRPDRQIIFVVDSAWLSDLAQLYRAEG